MQEENTPTGTSYPLRDNWLGIVLLISLLVIAGLTASITGYRIKLADKERKSELQNTYQMLGGTREALLDLPTSRLETTDPTPKNIMIATYEINERCRSIGLYRVLEVTPSSRVQLAIEGLRTIDSKDASLVVETAFKAFEEYRNSLPTGTGTNPPTAVDPKSSRLAKKYDRYVARDVETKLFVYLQKHKGEIAPAP